MKVEIATQEIEISLKEAIESLEKVENTHVKVQRRLAKETVSNDISHSNQKLLKMVVGAMAIVYVITITIFFIYK